MGARATGPIRAGATIVVEVVVDVVDVGLGTEVDVVVVVVLVLVVLVDVDVDVVVLDPVAPVALAVEEPSSLVNNNTMSNTVNT